MQGVMGQCRWWWCCVQAPLAGMMLVIEECASFFSVSLLFHSFLACIAAYYITGELNMAVGDNANYEFSMDRSVRQCCACS